MKFTSQIGGVIEPDAYRPYNGNKHTADYIIHTDLYWTATSEITKEISLTTGGQLPVGATKQLNAAVRTKTGDGSFGPETNVNTGSGGQTTWTSSNPSVASVSSSGLIRAVGKGTTTITVLWVKDGFQLTTSTVVTVGDDSGGGENPPGGGEPIGSCTYSISSPVRGTTISGSAMEPTASGVLKADSRGAERFDVLRGIPTSESLYANVFGASYLFQHRWVNLTGTVTYSVPVSKTYHKTWTLPGESGKEPDDPGKPPEPQDTTEQVQQTITVKRDYSYWIIDNLEVYRLAEATVENYALGGYGGSVTLSPSGYSAPTVTTQNEASADAHVHPAVCNAIDLGTQEVSGGETEPPTPQEGGLFQAQAESSIQQVEVNNDQVIFNGATVMNNARMSRSAPAPGSIPQPGQIGQQVLYQSGLTVSRSLINQPDNLTTGTLRYSLLPGNINGGADKTFSIPGMNRVTVHTPVVMYPGITDDKKHNQRITPNVSRAALILDRPFTVTLPTNGQHQQAPGYGNRDYAKYTASKQVLFPFAVWNSVKSQYIPANTWIEVPVSQEQVTFQMPTWVDEGDYTVWFRSIAENAPANFSGQTAANLDLAHHAAMNSLEVEVIGRLYDFRVTDITDYNWERVFRSEIGKLMSSGAAYWVGLRNIDGGPRGNAPPFKLPVHPGSHPDAAYRNVAVKTGYTFRFDVMTKGNMFSAQDSLQIKPSFDYVSLTGSERFPVDLYYHSGDQSFIKIGSREDVVSRGVILNEPMRNVPDTELIDTALYRYDHDYTFGQISGLSREAFVARFIGVFAKRPVGEGTYHALQLTEGLRTLAGPKSGVPASVAPQRALAAVQKWYGEYSLPAGVYVVKHGTNLAEYGRTHQGISEHADIFLKNGYIVVNFDIQSIAAGQPRLTYRQTPLMNQWQLEGYEGQAQDAKGHIFQLKDGDVVFYDADLSSRDDFLSTVTH
ncbi:hypothetical protein AWM70_21995 [Paenibacillus yonginensis]|uniref:BIG2 domain-containing protein n=1 Tax=Paenibacillus yonginensis TaxID=1462996 RepID=A0A1B1N683_9BACL|nr:DUF5704 domain-containing protein [Paenibacillus yonginensis]ANS76922.1 hypothetical protein AWM70_21995 [Paenibacillus yonginensis]